MSWHGQGYQFPATLPAHALATLHDTLAVRTAFIDAFVSATATATAFTPGLAKAAAAASDSGDGSSTSADSASAVADMSMPAADAPITQVRLLASLRAAKGLAS